MQRNKSVLNLYSIFHLNLAYSSIPESKRGEVIERCFWPLLRLATEDRIPVAIEAPAYTLEVIAALEPSWIAALRKAVDSGTVEFVGSGYSQLIGPLVPAPVNEWNLAIGNALYDELLGHTPEIWYINEQAYSSGMVEHYVKAGAKAIVMEWNNPSTLHPEWDEEYRYHPQVAIGLNTNRIPVIWNDSITFQKFQRVAQGDIDLEDLISYVRKHRGDKVRNFCLYGNDAEIFDFRPGRFETEPELHDLHEWSTIREIYHFLRSDPDFELIFPSDVLRDSEKQQAYIPLSLESAAQPIPVKKQPKYNITRWAVTGRNNLFINTKCHEIYSKVLHLSKQNGFSKKEVHRLQKELCYLWSSDFRTHITQERWEAYLKRLRAVSEEMSNIAGDADISSSVSVNGLEGRIYRPQILRAGEKEKTESSHGIRIAHIRNFLHVDTPAVKAVLNCKRGLAIQGLLFPQISQTPLIGTIPHGYFKDVALSADWYSGNTVLQRPGRSQITDLRNTQPTLEQGTGLAGEWVGCSAEIGTDAGMIRKRVVVYKDIPQIDIDIMFDWDVIPHGSFKTGMVTLIPESFDKGSLFYATQNGGYDFEVFRMNSGTISHDTPGSSIVSASHGLGATEGTILLGDSRKGIAVCFDQAVCAAMPMVIYKEAMPSFFCRLMFSCGEMDESRVQNVPGPLHFSYRISGLQKQ